MTYRSSIRLLREYMLLTVCLWSVDDLLEHRSTIVEVP